MLEVMIILPVLGNLKSAIYKVLLLCFSCKKIDVSSSLDNFNVYAGRFELVLDNTTRTAYTLLLVSIYCMGIQALMDLASTPGRQVGW